MNKRHFQVTLHFTVTANEDGIPSRTYENDPQDYNDPQRRLLTALLSNAELFDRYMEYMNSSQWASIILDMDRGCDHESILSPLLPLLSQSDQELFKGAAEHGVFYENTEELIDCFSTEMETLEITEIIQVDGEDA